MYEKKQSTFMGLDCQQVKTTDFNITVLNEPILIKRDRFFSYKQARRKIKRAVKFMACLLSFLTK